MQMTHDPEAANEAFLASIENQWLWTMGLGVGAVFVGFVVYRWLRDKKVSTSSASREEQERTQREIAAARLQGVLTLQLVFNQSAFQSIANQLPSAGNGIDAMIELARKLRTTRDHWLYAAARGTVLMDEQAAAAEATRMLDIFQERASSSDYRGAGLILLTIAARAPSDYCEVMPGDIEGFEVALSLLTEVDSRGACGFQLQASEVSPESLPDVVPGLIEAHV